MRIAVISDVHANMPALQAVMSDLRQISPDLLLCPGDLVGYGPFPDEVIDCLRSQPIETKTVLGNYDEAVALSLSDCGCICCAPLVLQWTIDHTSDTNKHYLKALDRQLVLSVGKYRLLVVHGSPRSINEYLYEDTPEGTLNEFLTSSKIDVLLCGHTHIPYVRTVTGGTVINAGSVGLPENGDPRAHYAVLDLNHELRVTFRSVEYPVEQTATEIEQLGLPPEFASFVRWGMGYHVLALAQQARLPEGTYDILKVLKLAATATFPLASECQPVAEEVPNLADSSTTVLI